jgi:uncharacterized protein (TIRG00374 family)
MKHRPGRILFIAVTTALAAVLLYYSVRGIEWRRVAAILRGARAPLVTLYCCTTSAALFLRAFRWRILLRSQGDVSVSMAFWATSAGYFGNNFLPARAGEVVRTMMISARTKLGRAFVLTTALSERMADGIALVTISAFVLLTLPNRPGWFARTAKPFAIAGLGAVIAIAILPLLEPLMLKMAAKLPLGGTLLAKLAYLIEQVAHGIRSFHHPGRIAGFLGLTGVIWVIDSAGAVIVAHALGLSLGLAVAFLLIAGLGMGSALPSTPGYVGIYQFVAVSVLTPFGLGRTDAIAYIVLWQALGYVVVTFWGSLAFWKGRGSRSMEAV